MVWGGWWCEGGKHKRRFSDEPKWVAHACGVMKSGRGFARGYGRHVFRFTKCNRMLTGDTSRQVRLLINPFQEAGPASGPGNTETLTLNTVFVSIPMTQFQQTQQKPSLMKIFGSVLD